MIMYCVECGKQVGDTHKFCNYCGTKQDAAAPVISGNISASPATGLMPNYTQPPPVQNQYVQNQIVFAPWGGYHYAGTIDCVVDGKAYITFIDGDKKKVPYTDIIPLQEALQTMALQADWLNHGSYYDCAIIGGDAHSLTVQYEDGATERVHLRQLRVCSHSSKTLRNAGSVIGSFLSGVVGALLE